MALEDRCSPQSANSPPGLPQSPQSNSHPFQHHHQQSTINSPCPTTSMLMLINNVIDSKTKLNAATAAMDYETSSLKSPEMSPTHLLSTIASKNLFNIQNQFMFQQQQQTHHSSPNSEKQNSSPPATPMRPTTDDEDEDEDEIDIENDPPKEEGDNKFLLPSPQSPASSQHSPSPRQISSPTTTTTSPPSGNLKFSISQILSDNFGIESKFHQHAMASAAAVAAVAQFKSGQHPLQQYPFYHPAAAAAAMAAGMMPNGGVGAHHHPHFPHNLPPHHPLLFRPYDALDVEIRTQQAAAAQQKMKNNFSSLFSSFQSQQQQQQQQQQHGKGTRSSLEDFCDSKLSQLSSNGPVISSNSSLSSSNSNSVNNSNSKVTTTVAASIKSPVSVTGSSCTTLRTDSGVDSSDDTKSETGSTKDENGQSWPAWIYCTRYSDRPSSGPRYRRPKQPKDPKSVPEDKRPRTAFSNEQLARLKREFNENRYLNERRRQELSAELGLNEAQIKIWFQNKRAKIKKTSGQKNPLAMQLMAQGLYNHTTVPLTKEEEELEMRMNGQLFD